MNHIIPDLTALIAPFSLSKRLLIANHQVFLNGELLLDTASDNFDDFLRQAYQELAIKYPKIFKMDAVCKLAMLGAHLLVPAACHANTAVLLANSMSTYDNDLAHYQSIQDPENYFPSPSIFAYTLPNIAAGEICIRYQLKGENVFFVMNEPDWDFLVNYTKDLFQHTDTQACLLGWVDCALPHYQAALFWIEK